MPIHNGEQFVAEAIQSLIAQTHTNWELIAVLDGCTDETEAAIRRFRDSRLRIIPLTPPGGFARALNYGLEHCQSELVARLDHDDVSLPTRLERQVDYLTTRPQLALLGTGAKIIDESGKVVGLRAVTTGVRFVCHGLLWRNQLIHPSVMFRRSLISSLGGYNGDATPILEDYDLWLRVIGHGEIDNLPDPLIAYRRRSGQMSRGSTVSRRSMRTLSRSRHGAARRLGVPRSASYFMELMWLAAQMRHEIRVVNRNRSNRA
jgi:glycosyltransferase involved in cell wall biosynthesis